MPTSAKEFAEYSDDSFASNISEDELRVQSPIKVNQKKKKKKVPKTSHVKKPASPYGRPMKVSGPKRTSEELWLDGIHKGTGLTASVKSSNYLGLTGKQVPQGSNCSDYLRENVLGMPPKSRRSQSAMDDTFTRSTKGVPVYKPPEDMYDDILELRKSVTGLRQENELIKARNRRLEDDNAKKEKHIDELMMGSRVSVFCYYPSDMFEVSKFCFGEEGGDVAIIRDDASRWNAWHSCWTAKVKFVKSNCISFSKCRKLSEDIKCTNIEEMKIAMETFYQEVQRLRVEQTENDKLSRSMKQSSNSNSKVKALNGTVLRLTEANQRLQSENKLLKLDLQRAMEKTPRTGGKGSRDYKDMDRQNLLDTLSKLESELEEVRAKEMKNSVSEANKKQLQDSIDRQEKEIKRLKEDKSKLKKTIDEQEQEIKELNGKLKKITEQILREAEEASKKKLARQSSTESLHHNTPRSRSGSSASLKRKKKDEDRRHEEQKQKAEELRKVNSAKSIQRNWRAHKKLSDDDEDEKEEEELDAATVTIQSAFRGHENRKHHLQQMNRYTPSPVNKYKDSNSDEEESDMEDVATTIQSAARGHWGRQKQLNSYSTRNSEISDAESVSSKRSVRSNKSNSSKKQVKSKKQIAREYLEDSDESDVLVTSKNTNNGKTSKKSVRKENPYGLLDSDNESDDELVTAPLRRRSYQFGR
ncbi:IQ domain-containing protein E-like [Anneissia japonica]|uniref:IQ domain-containing protein E-like n=1 Tax=Anneissia japonica TaxID=1529436 RepID=UPI0014257EC1|nr:IQ domain-containing protein E-like [Anneissia japonica]